MRTYIHSIAFVALMLGVGATTHTTRAQDQSLNSVNVIELALSSPIFMDEAAAVLNFALGELESARRWWVPSAAIGSNTFYRNGSALNANGDLIEGMTANSSSLAFVLSYATALPRMFSSELMYAFSTAGLSSVE